MQREKLYNLHTTTYSIIGLFVFKLNKTLSDQISTLRKLVAQTFRFYGLNCNKLYCTNCRAFHAASFGIFRFPNKEK